MGTPTVFSSRVRDAFLDYLVVHGNAAAAARAAGISYRTARDYYMTDELFRARWDEAMLLVGGQLEAAVYGRAMAGTRRFKVLKDGSFVRYPEGHPLAGQLYEEVEYNPARELALLKRFMPEEYRERSESRISATVQSGDMDDEELVARARRVLEDRELRAEGETSDGVRTVAPGDIL